MGLLSSPRPFRGIYGPLSLTSFALFAARQMRRRFTCSIGKNSGISSQGPKGKSLETRSHELFFSFVAFFFFFEKSHFFLFVSSVLAAHIHKQAHAHKQMILISSSSTCEEDKETFQTKASKHFKDMLPSGHRKILESIMEKLDYLQMWTNAYSGEGGMQGCFHADALQKLDKNTATDEMAAMPDEVRVVCVCFVVLLLLSWCFSSVFFGIIEAHPPL